MKKKNVRLVLLSVLFTALFLVYVPAFPYQKIRVTGREAELVCATAGLFCLPIPVFFASPTGYASATYMLSGYGIAPQRHYSLKITIYATDASTNVTTPITVILRDEYTACLELNIDQPPSCVS